MKIIVTGGAGFIGSHIVDSYIKLGYDVIVIDNLSSGDKKNINKKAKFYKADICDEEEIKKIFKKEKPDIVNHHAAQKDINFSISNPLEDAKINILGSINIIKNSFKQNVKKIIYASSSACYGNIQKKYLPIKESYEVYPINQYGLSKYIVELYLEMYNKESGLDFVSLRYSNVYGPRQKGGEAGVIPIFINKMLKNERPIIFGDGNQTRDFIYVDDVVRANIIALKKTPSHIYNISTSNQTSIKKLFYVIAKELNFKQEPIFKDALPREVKYSSLSYKKAKKELNWEPKISLEEGIKKTIGWFKRN
ncbi:MAG: NAD-dependent epimerase/dehydratase family protein [Candidatus Pacearchaeota archaeon]